MKIRTIATLCALPLLAACAPQVATTIRLSDVQKVLVSGKPIAVPATLRIPQPSEEDCTKGLGAMIEKLKTQTPVTGTPACVQGDDGEYIEAMTALQVVTPTSKIPYANLLALVVQPDTDGNTTLSFDVLKSVSAVTEALAGDEVASDTLDPTKFMITVDNDTSADVDALPGEVMLGGEPHLAVDAPITIGKGTRVEIGFNNVATAFLSAGSSYQFMAVTLPK